MNERKDYGLGEILKDFWNFGGDITAILCSMVAIQIFNKFNI